MGARRENGTPSAHTVLEVADGLRWTDPALGVSLAEHARRLAGDDDPATRSAAERSILRSLAEADRYDEVVHRAGPVLEDARRRDDRDAGAAVVVELASAAMGLGDATTAWTLLDRLPPVDELPARIAAAAALVRTRVRAEHGDVAGTDGEAERAVPALLRVPEPEAGLLRRELACARGRARRRAGDVAGALAVLATATTDDPRDDPDGGRRALATAAERIELLVESGRTDEARTLARDLMPHGEVEPALLRAVGRIRLVVAEAGGSDGAETRATAQALEDAGHLDDAARGWQVVAAGAEARGDLGEALAALRHGHVLESRARDEHARSLRRVAAVDVGDLLAIGRVPVEPEPEPVLPRSEPMPPPLEPEPIFPTSEPVPFPVEPAIPVGETPPPAVETVARPADLPRNDDVLESLPRRRGHHRDDQPRVEAAPALPDPPVSPDPLGTPPRVVDDGAGLGRQDELADLLAALSRSMEQLPGPAFAADDADPGPVGTRVEEPGPVPVSLPATASTESDPTTNAGGREEPARERVVPADVPAPTTGRRRSRHSAPADGTPPDEDGPTELPPATRPTFDAFSTAPPYRREEPAVAPALTSDLPESDHSGSDGPRSDGLKSDGLGSEHAGADATSSETSGRLGQPPLSADRFTPLPETVEPDRSGETRPGAELASPLPSVSPSPGGLGESLSPGDRLPSSDRRRDAPASGPSGGDRTEEPRPSRASGRPRPTPREDSPRGQREARPEVRPATGGAEPGDLAGGRVPREPAGASAPDEFREDLGLTLASVLGEYDLPDVPMPPRTDRARSSADVAVPSARRHTSGSMPVPAEGPQGSREREVEPPAPAPVRPSGANGRARPVESGPRLADLLAEAMDAFRHAGPAAQDESRPPGVGSRRA
ncbi:hypothetical protein [Actinomycetospora atypica]|uniref:Uncharacterized protein n=1 Tax=Actinomycetospora atypica TaxID=1290095 RepID=A0ABV9YU09_9PSEU